MEEIGKQLKRLCSVSNVSLSLLDRDGDLLATWPEGIERTLNQRAARSVINTFRRLRRDARHPMISMFAPGFLLGIVEIAPRRYVLIGLASLYAHTRSEILETIGEAIHPDHRGAYCDFLLKQPLMSLDQLKDMICLLTELCGEPAAEEDILFADGMPSVIMENAAPEGMPFVGKEKSEPHVPVNFESALCSAIETGNRNMLKKALFAPHSGRVGRMSSDDLQQQKYAFICLATLVSRAAIRGGMSAETAFSLSDLYCQRMDLIMDIPRIQSLTMSMLIDYCDKMREIHKQPLTSPVIADCLSYISVHLHDTVTLEKLSRHVGLCSRSLSLKFKAEMGMGITEYIHRERVREAEYLLKHTDYSLSEITSYLNYPTQSYFTLIFKKYMAATPQQFRDSSWTGAADGQVSQVNAD